MPNFEFVEGFKQAAFSLPKETPESDFEKEKAILSFLKELLLSTGLLGYALEDASGGEIIIADTTTKEFWRVVPYPDVEKYPLNAALSAAVQVIPETVYTTIYKEI